MKPSKKSLPSKGTSRENLEPIEGLHSHPRNYREHPDDELQHIMQSIRHHGFYRPIVAARDGTILAGHGVVAAARKMNVKEVPVVRLELDPEEPRALKLLAGDNEIGHMAEIDDRMLTEILKEVKQLDVDGLLGTGFDEKMLANLVYISRPSSEIGDFNAAAEWSGMPSYEEGSPLPALIVTFKNEKDRERFVDSVKLRIDKKASRVWSTRWPFKERDRHADFKFQTT
jgi:hypothetical protein